MRLTTGLIFAMALSALLWRVPGLDFFLASPDHGYQLAMGRQITLGKIPFVDIFWDYGPLAGYVSAIALWLTGSLLGEAITCAIGYALAIALVFRLVQAYGSTTGAVFCAAISYICLARFYKWYYWLFPLLGLWCYHLVLSRDERNVARQYVWGGLFAGIAALFRFDLGLACSGFYLVVILGGAVVTEHHRRWVRNLVAFGIGNAIPVGAWLLFLSLSTGAASVWDYLAGTAYGIGDAVTHWSLPFPEFDWQNPLSHPSALFMTFLLAIVTNLGAVCTGLGGLLLNRGEESKNLFMTGTGIAALGLMPQALYRPDVHHLLQVIPPTLVAGGILGTTVWHYRSLAPPGLRLHSLTRGTMVLVLVLCCVCMLTLRKGFGIDLEGLDARPWVRLSELRAMPLEQSNRPVARLTIEIERRTRNSDHFLVLARGSQCVSPPQLGFFANRPVAGILTSYWSGTFAGKPWRDRDLEAIQRNRPALVVAPNEFRTAGASNCTQTFFPELHTFLKSNYTRVVFAASGWLLLAPHSHPGYQGALDSH